MNETAHDRVLDEAYAQADFATRLKYIRVSIVLFLLLMPTFSALDWVVYREHFYQMLRIRLAFDAVFLLILLLTLTPLTRYIRAYGVVGALTAGLSISWLVFISEGAASPYYAGLNLILVVMSVLLPWTVSETAVVCSGTITGYLGACHLHLPVTEMSPEETSLLMNNLFFLAATSVICITASHYQSVRRVHEFRLNYELGLQNEKLAELDRLKSNFFANISHELRTPLTLILAPIQDLLGGAYRLQDQVAGRLGTVRDNALRLLKLVNDLLDVLRLEEGKVKLERVPVRINPVLSGLADSMVHLAATKDIQLEKALSSSDLVIEGDPRALEKIFVNLMSNAVKFTPQGGRIIVESEERRDRARIRVIDTGIGIAREELPHIFDRFHQVDGSTTRRYQGTGLGLALVKEMVERQDGEVSVTSVPGKGTVMTVELPLAERQLSSWEPSGESDALMDLHRSADRTGGLSLEEPDELLFEPTVVGDDGRPSVLVVDDEPDMRRYLTDMLQDDFCVYQGRDGTEGLALARQHRPALMLLDLMLPEIDGLQVCKRLKGDADTRAIKIMLLTARVDEQAKLTALEAGADDFLTKPFSSVEVRTRLRNLLTTAELERQLAERNRGLEKTLAELKNTQGKLIHSEKLNALGNLSAGLLHEINNPLNYSLTALQLIRADASVTSNELLNEVVSDIDEGMQRIRTIVSDLRAFAYPSENEQQTPFDFADALDSALRFTAHETKGIEVQRELAPERTVLGSQSHIVQVLINLITNAAKAIGSANPAGRILVSSQVRDGRLRVTVSDNGEGMEAETLSHIFEPFFTTRDVGDGVGMGLSICHTIVENHGGRLTAESTPGEGAALTFDLMTATEDGK